MKTALIKRIGITLVTVISFVAANSNAMAGTYNVSGFFFGVPYTGTITTANETRVVDIFGGFTITGTWTGSGTYAFGSGSWTGSGSFNGSGISITYPEDHSGTYSGNISAGGSSYPITGTY